MPTRKYLDDNGLLYLWGKIKAALALKANASSVPTKTSDLTNDAGFITSSDVPEGAVASSSNPLMDGEAAPGSAVTFARGDHRHPSDTSKQDVISDLGTIRTGAAAGATAVQPGDITGLAPKASPALTGTPTAPTAAAGTNTTQIATTAFVKDAVDTAKADLAKAYHYKGSKATYANLPSTGNQEGDVWNVEAAYGNYPPGTNWAWTGTTWDPLGGSVDLSGYLQTSDVTAVTNAEIDTIVAS